MTIAIPAQEVDLSSPVDDRFGRAVWFHVIDTETGERHVHENTKNLHAVQGAGVQAAQAVIDLGVEAVVTGHCGPKAFAVLKAADVDVYVGARGTVEDAIEAFAAGTLEEAKEANREGHWV